MHEDQLKPKIYTLKRVDSINGKVSHIRKFAQVKMTSDLRRKKFLIDLSRYGLNFLL